MGRKGKPSCIRFDENSRREFITGFHKRKVERRKKFNEKLEQELKEAKKRIKIQAREMTKKMTSLHEASEDSELPVFQKYYELPEHVVQVRELFVSHVPEVDAEDETRRETRSESESDYDSDTNGQSKLDENATVPGMQFNSIKSIRKMVSKKSAALMQRDRAFRKVKKIERAKNRKEAAKRKKSLEKGKKLRKGKQKR